MSNIKTTLDMIESLMELTNFYHRNWQWDNSIVNENGDINIKECSFLGDTSVSLTSTYEGSNNDLYLLQVLLENLPKIIEVAKLGIKYND